MGQRHHLLTHLGLRLEIMGGWEDECAFPDCPERCAVSFLALKRCQS